MNSETIELLERAQVLVDTTIPGGDAINVIVDLIDAVRAYDLEHKALQRANDDLEAENLFLRQEVTYCAERLAKLAEKKE
jgi:hypothetical protein